MTGTAMRMSRPGTSDGAAAGPRWAYPIQRPPPTGTGGSRHRAAMADKAGCGWCLWRCCSEVATADHFNASPTARMRDRAFARIAMAGIASAMGAEAGLEELNAAQREAVLFGLGGHGALPPGPPLLIVAGAGTGKTNTLAHRVAHLILEGADPRADPAAHLHPPRRRGDDQACASGSAPRGWAATARSAAGSSGQARSTPSAPGCCATMPTPSASIPASPSSIAATRPIYWTSFATSSAWPRTDRRFPKKGTCLAIYSYAVNAQAPLDELLRDAFPWCAEWARRTETAVRRLCRGQAAPGVLDYDDLLLWWERMLRVPEVAADVGRRFDFVLVDEYQDTNAHPGRHPAAA